MANPKYAASDKPVPVAELVATLSDGTKVKRRIPRMRACNEKDEKGKLCAGHLKRWYHFGDEVAMIVEACSDTNVTPKPPWKERKEAYLAHLRAPDTPDSVLRVSLADKLHNARTILSDYRTFGDDLWERFNTRSADDQLWYYGELAQIFSARMPGPLSSELSRVITELAQLIAVGFVNAPQREAVNPAPE